MPTNTSQTPRGDIPPGNGEHVMFLRSSSWALVRRDATRRRLGDVCYPSPLASSFRQMSEIVVAMRAVHPV
jgi:hypothetical protein